MSSSGTVENGSLSSATLGSITCSMNTPSPGCAAMPIHPSPMPSSALAEGHQRAAAGVAQQHHGFGAAPLHLVVDRLHVDDAVLVQAVGVVVLVAGAEAEDRVAGRGQQRAGVVHAEVTAGWLRMTAVFHGRPFGGVQSTPRTSAPSGETRRIDSRGMSTPGSSSGERPEAVAERTLAAEVDVEVLHARHHTAGPRRPGEPSAQPVLKPSDSQMRWRYQSWTAAVYSGAPPAYQRPENHRPTQPQRSPAA